MTRTFNSFYAGSGMKRNAFFAQGFGDPEDRRIRVQAAATRRVAPELLEILRAQNEALPPSAVRAVHIQSLAEPGTAVVATGQQVGLFLGPLYTVYKAASAVAIARALTAETGIRCVPLFWLQTEDQDFAEIATCVTPLDKTASLRLQLAEDPSLARCSLADRVLGPDVTSLIDELEPAIAELPNAAEVLSLLRTQYRPGVSPGRAFAGVLATIFADDGLIIVDPRCPTVAKLAAPLIRTALVDALRLESALTERGHALDEAGFSEQIELRPGSPLAFFHSRTEQGPRYRLGRRGDDFAVLGTDEVISESDLLALLESQPLRFSTSALLRPILQDSLFPVAVYVGGPAEVNYFAQLAPLYAAFGLEPPLVAERSHFRLIPHRIKRLLEKVGLTAGDLGQPREALVRKLSPSKADAVASPSVEWAAEIEQRLNVVAAEAPAIDPTLTRAVDRTKATVRRALERLAHRHARAVLARDAILRERLTRLEGWLRPDGVPQERVFSFPAFVAQVGLAEFHRRLMAAVDPFDPSIREIEL